MTRRRRSLFTMGSWLLALAIASGGCGVIIGADFEKPFQTGGTSGGTGGSGGGGAPDAGSDAASDAPVDSGPQCTVQSSSFDATADSQLPQGSGASITYGNNDFINTSDGGFIRGILRFHLGAGPAFDALQSGSAPALALTLSRVLMAGACGGQCPYAPGKLRVYPVRNDWREGMGGSYDGVNWFQRDKNLPWYADGASSDMDHGLSAGLSAALLGTEMTVTVPLDPSVFPMWVDATNHEVALLLVGESGLVYVFGTKETGTVPAARLDVSYCSGDI